MLNKELKHWCYLDFEHDKNSLVGVIKSIKQNPLKISIVKTEPAKSNWESTIKIDRELVNFTLLESTFQNATIETEIQITDTPIYLIIE